LAVVAFHAFPERVGGGFIGVDIFFVISGFLISSILLRSLEGGSFRFSEFYARRVRRIFPALIVVLAAVAAFGWFALDADEYAQLGKHVFGGATFVANFTLWDESGYFDGAAAAKPLLHLWSLGIEEQFYIVWPLALWLAARFRVNWLIPIAGVGLASFIANILTVRSSPLDAFYFPHTRFWELMAGAMLAFNEGATKRFPDPTPRTANALSCAGFAAVAVGLGTATKTSAFPGWWALLPTLGAVAIILAGNRAWINRAVLSSKPMVAVGLISYPLYLWHWPLLSYARILVNPHGLSVIDPNRATRLSLVAVSVMLAWLTYWIVERPIRFGSSTRSTALRLVTAMLLVAVAGAAGPVFDGFPRRLGPAAASVGGPSAPLLSDNYRSLPSYAPIFNSVPAKRGRDFFLVHPAAATHFDVAILGDSHGWILYDGLSRTSERAITMVGRGSCPPLRHIDARLPDVGGETPLDCQPLVDNILDYFGRDDTRVIVLTAYFEQYQDFIRLTSDRTARVEVPQALRETLVMLARSGKPIVLAHDVPEVPQSCYRRQFPVWSQRPRAECTLSRQEYESNRRELVDVVRDVSREFANVSAYDPAGILCTEQRCGEIDGDHLLYTTDGNHLNAIGAERLGRDFEQFLGRLLHSR
jgi:peptidoglycan/LPS O-acetylase OafA/YrhL